MADASSHQEQSSSPPQQPKEPLESRVELREPNVADRVRGRLAGWFRDRFDPSAVTEERMKAFDAVQKSFSGTPQEIIGRLREPWRRLSQVAGIAEVSADISLAALYGLVSFGIFAQPSAVAGAAFMGTLFAPVPGIQGAGVGIGALIGLRFAGGYSVRTADTIAHRIQPLRRIDQHIFRAAGTILPRVIETGKTLGERVDRVVDQIRHDTSMNELQSPLGDHQVLEGSSASSRAYNF